MCIRDRENVSFDDKRRVVDLMIITVAATSDSLNITWKILSLIHISREEAAQIASKFSGIAANNLQEDSDEDGNMASCLLYTSRCV